MMARFRAVVELLLACAAVAGCAIAWTTVRSTVAVAPVAKGQPATTSVVYDPSLLLLTLLLATAAGMLAVVGTADPRIFGNAAEQRPDSGIVSLGRVSDEELKGLYSRARALLFPSLAEGFGLPALEAMACGCPVVASDAGALPETCGEAALFCSPDRPEEWARTMDALAGDDAQLLALSAAGERRAAEFTWGTSALKLLDVLQR